jgi:hypothetical protein
MPTTITAYTFDASERKITFTDAAYTTILPEKILEITNTTRNINIWTYNTSSVLGSVLGNTITLLFDTTSMSDGDSLTILYDVDVVASGAALASLQQTDALTNAQIRATPLPVSVASLPLPTDAATEATLVSIDKTLSRGDTFSMLFERSAGTFGNNTDYNDCCEFLLSGQTNFIPVTTSDSLEVISTSVDDTSAGIGTRTVGILYLDSSGVWSQTIATLNGTTAVSVPITASAIISMYALTGGTNAVSSGDINLRKVGTPTTIYEQIKAKGNQSQSGRFKVPTGYYAILRNIAFSVQGQTIELKMRINRNPFDNSTTTRYLFNSGVKLAAGSAISIPLDSRVDAGQEIKISGIADATAGNPRVHGTLDLALFAL